MFFKVNKVMWGALLIVGSLLPLSCANVSYDTIDNGVLVHFDRPVQGMRCMQLLVEDEKVIRVTASAERSISETPSLIVAEDFSPVEVPYTVDSFANCVTLSTASVKAVVDLETGAVQFFTVDGKLILSEQLGGGKSFTPIEVEGKKGYTLRQVFESPSDEAFYGLGQHQADEFNYKGKNETLLQYNTKITVPFILSSNNYALLWDNYSLSRFGDERDYAPLSIFTLYNAKGEKGGLTATYTPRDGEPLTRIEQEIAYENLKQIKNLPKMSLLDASAVYEGLLEAPESGEYQFYLYYAGYVRVIIGGKEVVKERWRTAWNPNGYKFTVPFSAGVKVPIRIEWRPDGNESYLGLRALSPRADAEREKLALWSEMGEEIDYYFIYGEDMDEVISGYRFVTGKSQILPKWAMGYWQSRERYKTQDEVIDAVESFRKRHIPLDNIILDWSYWPVDAWGSHEFDEKTFPDPKGMIDKVHQLNAHFMISVWPKFYHTTEHYKEFDEKGWMYQRAVQDSIRDWIYPGYIGSFYDAYSLGARRLFWKQLNDHLYPLGIDSWWMDASEPNVRDCTDLPYRKALCGPTALGSSTEYFNAYGLMNAEAIYYGQRHANPDSRVFLLTRSGFAGLQRYSTASWSGDIATRWEDMKAQISAGINFAMSGIPYWTMDIGGFSVERRYETAQRIFDRTGVENKDLKEWRELNARWYQFGAFCPLFRAHGQFPYREIYNIAPATHPAYKTIKAYTELRYRLMPYIYTLAGKTHFDDYTIMRGLVMDFPSDPAVRNIGDQYMFGPSLMVCPVYTYGARSRQLYLPAGTIWYDFYTGKALEGGKNMNYPAPYEKMPLFVRAGSILPTGPLMQYTDEKPADPVTLYVYAGADGHFTLYEDEGVNYEYEKGNYAMIDFSYNDKTGKLTIGERKGSFPGMLKHRTFNVVKVDEHHPASLTRKGSTLKVVYEGNPISIQL